MQTYTLDFEPNTVLFREGDPGGDLYYLESGKLLVCTINGTEVKVLAKIGPGEFIGELSFFDNKPRSSHIVALEKSTILQIPKFELTPQLPRWYLEVGKGITKKIRALDQIVQDTKLRKSEAQETKPLSIEEQRSLLDLLTK